MQEGGVESLPLGWEVRCTAGDLAQVVYRRVWSIWSTRRREMETRLSAKARRLDCHIT